MDLNASKPHIEWIKLRKRNVWHYVKILQVGSKKQEYMEFPPEMKKDPDPSQDIHFSPFPVLLVLQVSREWDNMDQLANDELWALSPKVIPLSIISQCL